ncbi:unnamed protein product, partial [marine sediment metagenome]
PGSGGIMENLIKRLKELEEKHKAPNGQEYQGLSLKSVGTAAKEFNLSKKEVEIAALKNEIVPLRYQRNIGTIGMKGQIKLLKSTVAVIGAGGLGGGIIELLARQGIGHIIIADNDRFTESTLNRQLMSTEKDIGKYKAQIAADRVRAINSSLIVTSYTDTITEGNVKEVLKSADVVADGLDLLPPRFMVAKAAKELSIPFVYGAIAGFVGQAMTIFPEDEGLSLIYGKKKEYPQRGDEVTAGNPSATPTMITSWQVQ